MAKTRITCIIPISEDPTSFYRGAGPLARLQKENDDIHLLFPQSVSWATLQMSDILFMQRPATPDHFSALCMAKNLGMPVWVDFDDDNLAVPKDNPAYGLYNTLQVKESIIKLARHCDILSVSTEFLKKKYGIYNKNTVLIPNAIDDSLLHLRQIPPTPRNKRIMWRGTQSHTRNLMTVGKELISLSRKHEDWKFVFFGMDPIDLTDHIRNHELVAPCDIISYFQNLCVLHATCLYYPLGATSHAQARSHISWLEGTFAGCVTLASKNDEFTRPGMLNFSTPAEFEAQVDAIIRGDYNIDQMVEDSWNEIQSKYMLRHTNPLRLDIIKQLSQ